MWLADLERGHGYICSIGSSRFQVNSDSHMAFRGTFHLSGYDLFHTFNLLIYDFDWFYHEVQTFVDFGLIKGITMVSSGKHFLRTETWNTGWMLLSSEGSRSLLATGSILMRISKSIMYYYMTKENGLTDGHHYELIVIISSLAYCLRNITLMDL